VSGLLGATPNRQFRNSIHIQKENYRDRLKLDVYKSIAEQISNASNTVSKGTIGLTLPITISSHCRSIEINPCTSPMKERISDIMDIQNAISNEMVKLIVIMENYQIINPKIDIFNLAFSASLENIRYNFTPFFNELLKYLPSDHPDPDNIEKTKTFVPRVPNESERETISNLGSKYYEACSDLNCYIYDLRIECQNTILGTIFEDRLPKRMPLDPKFKVVSTEDSEIPELKNYFNDLRKKCLNRI